jgi:hypothetical protein
MPDKQSTVQCRPTFEAAAERSAQAHRVNAQQRRVIEALPHDPDHSTQFFCECGCGDAVLLTIAEYDALAGKPVHRCGHPA